MGKKKSQNIRSEFSKNTWEKNEPGKSFNQAENQEEMVEKL